VVAFRRVDLRANDTGRGPRQEPNRSRMRLRRRESEALADGSARQDMDREAGHEVNRSAIPGSRRLLCCAANGIEDSAAANAATICAALIESWQPENRPS
jgi:hypothetical protein